MLDGLLGRGFSSKCKSLIKLTRTRLDVIMRKRNAMQKYLKKDIADLLANGLDINAYGRAEGLSVELNLSFCYEFVEQLCEFIPKNLSVMQKQRECPEEFREAVSSLMFAAARFADLPELRDLRDLFRERYGSNLEAFANREFVDSLASKPPTTEKKLQLMQEIAQEFSIKWDSKAFKQQIANSPAQDQTKRQSSFKDPQIHGNKQHGSRDEIAANQDVLSTGRRGLSDDGYILNGNREETAFDRESLNVPSNRRRGISADGNRGEQTISDKDNPDVLSRRRSELTDDRYKQDRGSRVTNPERDYEYTDDRFKPRKDRDHITRKREKHDLLSRDDYTADGFKPHKVKDDTLLKRDDLENSYHGRRKHDTGRELNNGMEDTVRRRDKQDVSSYKEQVYPTTTHKIILGSKEETSFAGDNYKTPHNHFKLTEKASNGAESTKPLPPPPYLKPNGGKYKSPAEHPDNKSERTQAGLDRAVYDDERRVVEPPRVNGQDYGDHQDDLGGGKKQKPKSVRRKHLKPPPGQDYRDNNEADEVVKRNPNGRRREDTRQGLQHALEDNRKSKDEDERMMDKLLMHYSKKPSKFEHVKVKEGLNPPPGHHDVGDAGEPQRHRRKDAAQVPPPSRAVSLPPEPVTPSEKERVPAPTRATSFQPEMMNPGAHVHPRLPDYDDLAARFAALRGR